jgi:hypothetical protein
MSKLENVFMEIKILMERKDEIYKRSLLPIDKKIEKLKKSLSFKDRKLLEELLS